MRGRLLSRCASDLDEKNDNTLTFVFTAAMFITFEIAFDVIMPKGPLERLLGY